MGTDPLVSIVIQPQLRFLGHKLRRDFSHLHALYVPPREKRKPGRPPTNFLKYICVLFLLRNIVPMLRNCSHFSRLPPLLDIPPPSPSSPASRRPPAPLTPGLRPPCPLLSSVFGTAKHSTLNFSGTNINSRDVGDTAPFRC